MKRLWALSALFVLAVMPLAAQQSSIMDTLLDQKEARYAEVVYMTLSAAGLVKEQATPQQAVSALSELGWKISSQAADSPITLGRYSELLMTAFTMKGGILYRIFKGPRYACRELGWLKIITSDVRPGRTLSGEEAVRILGNLMAYTGGQS